MNRFSRLAPSGGYYPNRYAQDLRKGAIPNQPPRQGTGEKGGRVMT
jgi:hypothetical protein